MTHSEKLKALLENKETKCSQKMRKLKKKMRKLKKKNENYKKKFCVDLYLFNIKYIYIVRMKINISCNMLIGIKVRLSQWETKKDKLNFFMIRHFKTFF